MSDNPERNGHADSDRTAIYAALGADLWDMRSQLSSSVLEARRPLSRKHIDDLLGSGWTVETIRFQKVRTVEGPYVNTRLNWKGGGHGKTATSC